MTMFSIILLSLAVAVEVIPLVEVEQEVIVHRGTLKQVEVEHQAKLV